MYRVETPDGDVWNYDDLEDAQRATYIFGGTITEIGKGGTDGKTDSCRMD